MKERFHVIQIALMYTDTVIHCFCCTSFLLPKFLEKILSTSSVSMGQGEERGKYFCKRYYQTAKQKDSFCITEFQKISPPFLVFTYTVLLRWTESKLKAPWNLLPERAVFPSLSRSYHSFLSIKCPCSIPSIASYLSHSCYLKRK